MAIDDRISAAQDLIASDERQRSPVTRHLLAIVECLPPPVKAAIAPITDPIATLLNRQREENREYLVEVLKKELKDLKGRLENLTAEHQKFLQEDYLLLVSDGLKKAENLRGEERIARIGKILAHAAEQGPVRSMDDTEEMMRVAMALIDEDVLVLREVCQAQTEILKGNADRIVVDEVNNAWRDHKPRLPRLTEGALQSICAKLQSYGLLLLVERRNSKLGVDEIPYALLPKGRDFVHYIRAIAETKAATCPSR